MCTNFASNGTSTFTSWAAILIVEVSVLAIFDTVYLWANHANFTTIFE